MYPIEISFELDSKMQSLRKNRLHRTFLIRFRALGNFIQRKAHIIIRDIPFFPEISPGIQVNRALPAYVESVGTNRIQNRIDRSHLVVNHGQYVVCARVRNRNEYCVLLKFQRDAPKIQSLNVIFTLWNDNPAAIFFRDIDCFLNSLCGLVSRSGPEISNIDDIHDNPFYFLTEICLLLY